LSDIARWFQWQNIVIIKGKCSDWVVMSWWSVVLLLLNMFKVGIWIIQSTWWISIITFLNQVKVLLESSFTWHWELFILCTQLDFKPLILLIFHHCFWVWWLTALISSINIKRWSASETFNILLFITCLDRHWSYAINKWVRFVFVLSRGILAFIMLIRKLDSVSVGCSVGSFCSKITFIFLFSWVMSHHLLSLKFLS